MTKMKMQILKNYEKSHPVSRKQWIVSCCLLPQGTSTGGVKRAKVESWERSVGTLGGGGALGSLVVRKKPAAAVNKPGPVAAAAAPTSRTGNTSVCLTAYMKASYGLTLLSSQTLVVFFNFISSPNICPSCSLEHTRFLYVIFLYVQFFNCLGHSTVFCYLFTSLLKSLYNDLEGTLIVSLVLQIQRHLRLMPRMPLSL